MPILLSAWLLLGTASVPADAPPAKRSKGVYYQDAMVADMARGQTCRPDSGQGLVMELSRPHENPLFPSKKPNEVHLLIWFQDGIEVGKRYTLPQDQVKVCYWEEGDLLMFHTFRSAGWVEFSEGKPGSGKLAGSMDLKLVEPHHNMSNSDYHYMGGEFVLSQKDVQP